MTGAPRIETASLVPVDALDVTILVDNFVDINLPSTQVARRAIRHYDWSARPPLRAEHGYALLATVSRGERRDSLLYDAGLGRDTLLHNMDVLEMRPTELRAVVLSHGHADHHGGLEGLFRRLGRGGTPLVLHPDAWRERRLVFPSGTEIHMPPPSRADLEAEGVQVVEERGPSLLLDDAVLVSGQTERTTDFEKGQPSQQARAGAGWEPDPWVWDDQSVIVHVRGRGLVVLSSCSHSGAVNVLRNAQRVTGVNQVHAFVGGLHLSGATFEAIIPQTVTALARIQPAVVVPGHCTGWVATHELARQLPDAYVQTSLGTTLRFAV
ncbi:MAG TPA: MBL fold metallo-hydrolase [Acidimicrobiales bacterium]|jgi:7,8-dihydropterin-6-yl-methyl-4-(beta-D-ribofuranosyl)aminobenzene 5'-phosphate synthase